MAVSVSLGRLYARSICSIFLRCMVSNAQEKSINKSVLRVFFFFFSQIPSKIRRIVRICDIDRFLRKPFSYFLKIFSVFGLMQLSSRSLKILAAMEIRVIPRQFFAIPMAVFLGKGRCSICPPFYCVLVIYGVTVSEQ